MEYNILALGDVASETGLQLLEKKLRAFKKEHHVRFTVVNGENISDTWASCCSRAMAAAVLRRASAVTVTVPRAVSSSSRLSVTSCVALVTTIWRVAFL